MTESKRTHRSSAPLLPPALSYAVLTLLSLVLPSMVAGVSPYSSDSNLLTFFQHHAGAAHLSAFLNLGAAVPLAVFTAVSTTRLRTLGVDVPGRVIAQIGGTLAAAMLALAGAGTLAATQDHVADSDVAVRVLNALTFATGGPAFVVFSGLLVAGVSIAGLLSGFLPRALGWAGIAVAVVSEIASLAAAFDAVDVLLPVGRFGALIWMVAIAFALPATRREWRDRRGIVRSVDRPADGGAGAGAPVHEMAAH